MRENGWRRLKTVSERKERVKREEEGEEGER